MPALKILQPRVDCGHFRLSSSAWLAGFKGGCLAGISLGVLSNGLEPSCIWTNLSRLPTSAPGPPPRVRVVSGLGQATMNRKRTMSAIAARLMSDSLRREDDDQPKNKAADQNQRGGRGYIAIAEPLSAPMESQGNQHANNDDAEKKQ